MAASERQPSLEVLVASMNQKDLSLVDKMQLDDNAIIANQCGEWDVAVQCDHERTVHMYSTATIGVGLNRNIALQLSTADILLFADDDVVYYEGSLQAVKAAFDELPDADVIIFGVDLTMNGEIYRKNRERIRRRHLWNALSYGTYRIAVRRAAIMKSRICFSQYFGGGCRYGCGEDTLFIQDCFRAGLHVYSHHHVLGTCAKDVSTWFTGYTDKYFFDKGAWLCCAFPRMKALLKWYIAFKSTRRVENKRWPVRQTLKNIALINMGIRAFKELRSYEEARAIEEQ